MKVSFLCANTYADPDVVNQATFPYPAQLYDRDVGSQSVEGALENARLADELGFDWVSLSEHHYAPGIMTPNAMVFAGALTQVVKRAKIAVLGPIVSVNNPVRIAEEIAMLDMMSEGRVVLFLLRGTPNEFNTYYINVNESRERAQEAIKLIEAALSEPQPFAWQGRYFQYPIVSVWPRPKQAPYPPISSSGNSPESCVFAAKNHHGLAMSFIPPHLVAKAVELYKSEAEKAGWTPTQDHIIYRSFVAVAESREEADEQKAHRAARPRAPRQNSEAPRGFNALSWLEDEGKTPSASGAKEYNPNEDGAARAGEGYGLGSLNFEGTPDDLVQAITGFHAMTGVGVLDLIFSNRGGPEGMGRRIRLFGEQVLPRVRALGVSEPAGVK